MARKSKIRYPTGVKVPKKPAMKTYNRSKKKKKESKKVSRAKIASAIRRRYSGNKYNAHRIYFDHHWFDSKIEVSFYTLLKFVLHLTFKPHPRYTIIKHQNYKSPITGAEYYIRKHSYTPDFEIDDKKTGKPLELIDIKGGKASPYANLRFDLLSSIIHLPVVIVKRRHKIFVQKIRGLHGNKTVPFKLNPEIKKRSQKKRREI